MAKDKQLITIEGVVKFESEDRGCALIAALSQNCVINGAPVPDEQEEGIFVQIQSWDKRLDPLVRHSDAMKISGRRVRVTIETIDE